MHLTTIILSRLHFNSRLSSFHAFIPILSPACPYSGEKKVHVVSQLAEALRSSRKIVDSFPDSVIEIFL
jgi:hypothetical protein